MFMFLRKKNYATEFWILKEVVMGFILFSLLAEFIVVSTKKMMRGIR